MILINSIVLIKFNPVRDKSCTYHTNIFLESKIHIIKSLTHLK